MRQQDLIDALRLQGISLKKTPGENEWRVTFTAAVCARRGIDAEAVAAYESDFASAVETGRAMRDAK